MCIATPNSIRVQYKPSTNMHEKNLTIGSWNLNGLYDSDKRCKLNNEWVASQVSKCDIFAIIESHCGDEPITFQNYYNIPIARKKSTINRYFGGISVFIHQCIKNHVSIQKTSTDSIWLKVSKTLYDADDDIFLCFCYLPPGKSTTLLARDILHELENDIRHFTGLGQILIGGDLNARTADKKDYIQKDNTSFLPLFDTYPIDENLSLRKNFDKVTNPRGDSLIDLCISAQLRIINGRKLGDTMGHFTCHKWNGSSVVDYFVASREVLPYISSFRVGEFNHEISDHCMISTVVDLPHKNSHTDVHSACITTPAPRRLNFNAIVKKKFTELVKNDDFQFKCNNIVEKLKKITNNEEGITDLNALLIGTVSKAGIHSLRLKNKNSAKKQKPPAWHDANVKDLRYTVLRLGQKLTRDPFNKKLRISYFLFLKKYRKANKLAKKEYLQNIIDQAQAIKHHDPKTFWQLLNQISEIRGPPKKTADPITPEKWVDHYKSLNTSHVPHSIDKTYRDMIDNQGGNATFNPLDFRITHKEITNAIKKLKNNKAMGNDLIASEMLKYAVPAITPCLSKIFNNILTNTDYPTLWAESYITNIYKKGGKLDPNNYRGIAISSTLGKTFNTILNNRLITYLSENKLINPSQIGFLKDSSTTDHILTLKTIIDKYTKSIKKTLYLCFVDFQKAFDSVWHTGLLYKLQNMGINGLFLQTLRNMYSKLSIRIKTDAGLTEPITSNVGVRQGDSLSPMLFNIFINDLPDIFVNDTDVPNLQNSQIPCLMYADDLILLAQTPEGLQSKLDSLNSYCKTWFLNINVSKTQTMTIRPPYAHKNTPKCTEFHLNNTKLESTLSYTYLGVVIDSKGSFAQQANHLNNKALKALYKLMKTISKLRLDITTQFHLFDHTIKPILLYASQVTIMTNLPKVEDITCKNDIEKIHKQFIRNMLGVHNKSSIDAIYSETGRFPLYIDALKQMCKYYNKQKKADPNLLINKALTESISLDSQGIKTWFSTFSHLSHKYNIPMNEEINVSRLTNLLQTSYIEAWAKRIKLSRKLRTFITFKQQYTLEPYISIIRDVKKRSTISKLRISAHNLQIEKGRHSNIPVDKRICKQCKTAIEDEAHFLISCPKYQAARQTLFSHVHTICPNYTSLNDKDKFIWIMSAENKSIIKHLVNFIESAYHIRQL